MKIDWWDAAVIAFLAVWYIDYQITKLHNLVAEVQKNVWAVGELVKELKGPGPY